MGHRFALNPLCSDSTSQTYAAVLVEDTEDGQTRAAIGEVRKITYRAVLPDVDPADGDWVATTAGYGIPGPSTRFRTAEDACEELLRLRAAAVDDGPLTIEAATGLRRIDAAILDFETQVPLWRHAGTKESEVRARFGLSSTRYYQILNHLLDDPAAEAYQPMTVRRLRRRRDRRRTVRGA